MRSDEDPEDVFGPWYEYLSTVELLIHGLVAAAMLVILWAGFTSRADIWLSIGLVMLFGGWITFLTQWSVSQQRMASLTAFENE
jgi:hypothetical protein